VYFWLNDAQLKTAVASIGKARVIEVAVPLDATNRAYLAGKAVVATFARSLGCMADFGAFDLYATRALGPDAWKCIRRVKRPSLRSGRRIRKSAAQ
jgi:hypothetical protein